MSPSSIYSRCPRCCLCLPHGYHVARSGGGSLGPMEGRSGGDGARGSGDMRRGQVQQRS
uniref:Uncharacterized protein n=1 Tax=Oryza punctata TaxID=4537 RepID=A0A0E0KP92_ORYPU